MALEGNNLLEIESGHVHQTKDLTSPESPMPLPFCNAASSSRREIGGKPPLPEKLKSFTRLMSKSLSFKKKVPKRLPSSAQMGLKRLRFLDEANSRESTGWQAVEKKFEQFAINGKLHKQNFGSCIGMDSEEFAQVLFDTLARRRCSNPVNSITKDELKEFWKDMTDQNFDNRVQIFFDMCDKNGDGKLTEDEVIEVIILSASANKLVKLKRHASSYAALIMEKLDPDQLGYIELWQLETLLCGMANPDGSNDSMKKSDSLMKTMIPTRYRNPITRFFNKTVDFVQENWKKIWVLALWLVLNISLFAWKFFQYRRRAAFEAMGYCLCGAKGMAETLKLNMALILIPVCRNTLTRLRSTVLNTIFPFDDNISFHKIIALAIVIGTLFHTLFHIACNFPRLTTCQKEKFMRSVGPFFDLKQPTYPELLGSTPGWTGIVMLLLMAFSFIFATQSFRKNVKRSSTLQYLAGFNVFWYAHHLLALVYVLLIAHSYFIFLTHEWYNKTTWMYIMVPVIFYACEKLIRLFREKNYHVEVLQATLYPGGVLSIQMTKPPGFNYKSGMYLFVKCPDISSFEWHPFSITSAPGDDYLSVHIRVVGDWTNDLMNLFGKVCDFQTFATNADLDRLETTLIADAAVQETRFPKLMIDGPYGAPAQNHTNYDVLLLIGVGIGATPFISILKDLLNNLNSDEEIQNRHISDINSEESRGSRRAYLYWVTKEQDSLEWFKGVMNTIAESDQNHVIQMHNYLTSVFEKGDVRSALIAMVQSIQQAKDGLDIVSGSQIHTHFARPNWRKAFSAVAHENKSSDIGVFYCGHPMLIKQLRELSHEFSNSTTHFHFHKENF